MLSNQPLPNKGDTPSRIPVTARRAGRSRLRNPIESELLGLQMSWAGTRAFAGLTLLKGGGRVWPEG